MGLVDPLAKRASVVSMMAASQWWLQIEEQHGTRDGAVALQGWRGEEMHREGGCSFRTWGPGWRRGLPEQGNHPWLFSTTVLGHEILSNLL